MCYIVLIFKIKKQCGYVRYLVLKKSDATITINITIIAFLRLIEIVIRIKDSCTMILKIIQLTQR